MTNTRYEPSLLFLWLRTCNNSHRWAALKSDILQWRVWRTVHYDYGTILVWRDYWARCNKHLKTQGTLSSTLCTLNWWIVCLFIEHVDIWCHIHHQHMMYEEKKNWWQAMTILPIHHSTYKTQCALYCTCWHGSSQYALPFSLFFTSRASQTHVHCIYVHICNHIQADKPARM